MGQLYLVRHGQASFGADNYDQLSELGYQQSDWLGEYFAERGIRFDRVFSGDLARQRQTAESICTAMGLDVGIETHSGLNEFESKPLLKSFLHHNPTIEPIGQTDPQAYYRHLREAMTAWSKGLLTEHMNETWEQFHDRVAAALNEATSQDGNVLVASSGGAISMALKQLLDFSAQNVINVNLQARNTGVSHIFFNKKVRYLISMNHVPHLDRPDRLDKITMT